MKGFKKMETGIMIFKIKSQWDRYTGFFPVPLAYKLIYYGNGINILRSHYNKFHIAKRPF